MAKTGGQNSSGNYKISVPKLQIEQLNDLDKSDKIEK